MKLYCFFKGIYGAGKLAVELNKKGITCSKSKVARAFKELGLMAISAKKFPKKKSRISECEKSQIVNRIKNITISRLNQVWTTDITYIKTKSRLFYLISFIDLFSRKVVAWDLAVNLKTENIIKVLDNARTLRNPPKGLIIHSDKGSQFRSLEYKSYLSKHYMVRSVTSLNHSCDENAHQESFHASLKKEAVYQTSLDNFDSAYRVIFRYIEGFYNPTRTHSALGYLSPNNFEKLMNFSKSPSQMCLNS